MFVCLYFSFIRSNDFFWFFCTLCAQLISESGEMCAMKEVTLFSDDTKSKESAKQLGQVCKFGSKYMDVKRLLG